MGSTWKFVKCFDIIKAFCEHPKVKEYAIKIQNEKSKSDEISDAIEKFGASVFELANETLIEMKDKAKDV